jgi:hypothetical protein
MEGSCSTGQSPQRAVVPVEEKEEEEEEEDVCQLPNTLLNKVSTDIFLYQ